MGADIFTNHNSNSQDHLLSNPYHRSIHYSAHYDFYAHSNPSQPYPTHFLNKNFCFTQESLVILARQQIVDNNFSQQFNPLFVTFRPQNKLIYGRFRILCSNITNQKIQEYKISFRNQHDFKTYLVSYFWRKNQHDVKDWPLVKTTNLTIYQESKRLLKGGFSSLIGNHCTGKQQIYCKLYVQDIPLRLCHIKDIPFPENLYVLRQVLKGFQIIYESIGYIKPFQDLICITRKGFIKVWINSDLSKNYPNVENIDQNITSNKSESKLINQILHMIIENTESTGQPISFQAYLRQQHVNMEFIYFDKIFQMIQRYESSYQVHIPDSFASLVEVFNQEEQEYDTYRTDMEHANEQQVQSSQPIQSQNRSDSNLFLNVPNSSSRTKSHRQKKRRSFKNQSTLKDTSKHNKKSHKTQSLRIGHNQHNSLTSSIIGAKSNIMLYEQLPLSGNNIQLINMNQPRLQTISKDEIPNSYKKYQSSSQIQRLTQINLVDMERDNEETQTQHNDSVPLMKDSKIVDNIKHLFTSSVPLVKSSITNQSEKLISPPLLGHNFDQSSQENMNNLFLKQSHKPQQTKSQSPLHQATKHNQINQNLHVSNSQTINIHSKNQIIQKKNRNYSEYLKNDKKYCDYWQKKNEDYVLIDSDEIHQDSNNGMIIRVEATEEEINQMIEIDKLLQTEVVKEEQQKIRLSQIYKSRNQLLNKSQQLLNRSHQFSAYSYRHIAKQAQQRMNLTSIPQPPVDKNYKNDQISSRQQDISDLQMLTCRQKNLIQVSGPYSMRRSNDVPYLDQASNEMLIVNSHMVDGSMGRNQQQQVRENKQVIVNSNMLKLNMKKQDQNIGVQEQQENQTFINPQLQKSLNSSVNNLSSFNRFDTLIHLHPPSSSQRTHRNLGNILIVDNSKNIQNNLPNCIGSTTSNNVFVPASQYQIVKGNGHGFLPAPVLLSSTSIGHSIRRPVIKQVYFNANASSMISSPYRNSNNYIPKVTFTIKTPQQTSLGRVKTSNLPSMNQLAFSEQSIQNNQDYHNTMVNSSKVSQSNQNLTNQHINILSNRAQTMVSGDMQSQVGNINSEKYNEQEQGFSKRSIVEFSYLKNPQYFGKGQNVAGQLLNDRNQQISQKSRENSLQKSHATSNQFAHVTNEFTQDLHKKNIILGQNQILEDIQQIPKTLLDQKHYYLSGNYDTHLINIMSFESMQGVSKQEDNNFLNNLYGIRSKQGNNISFCSNKQYENSDQLTVGQKPSADEGSNIDPKAKSQYRVVESIEDNRPKSSYQMNIGSIDHLREFPRKNEQSYSNFKGQNLPKLDKQTPLNNKLFQFSPQHSQSHGIRIINKPITGRTMFINKENQLMSQFIDHESEMQSLLDYTYNSYGKWKDKFKVMDVGQSKLKDFDQQCKNNCQSTYHKFNNIALYYPERHGNHKQLVKSSIQGNKLVIDNHFVSRQNFNSCQKHSQFKLTYQLMNQQNQLYFESFQPQFNLQLDRLRKTSDYKMQQIDEDILNDLKQV